MQSSTIVPIEEVRDLNLDILKVVVDVSQLQGLPHTRCPECGEKALMVDIIEIMLSNSPPYLEDAEFQHAELEEGRMSFGGNFQVACTECDFGVTQFIEGSGEVLFEDQEDDDFLIMS